MKKKEIFFGAATALITPFSDGEIDYRALSALIDRQIDEGVRTLVIGGTTGEAATLSDAERYALYAFCKEKTVGRAKLILGTGTNDTRAAVAHTKFAKMIGADAALAVTPYYNKGTEEGIYRHYMMLAEAAEMPIILYNVPGRTGVNLGYRVLSRLAECEWIVGIKEASDSSDRLVRLSEFGDSLPLYAGNDSQIFTTLSLGGRGVISVISNILPSLVVKMCDLFKDGAYSESLALQHKLLPIIEAMFLETNPTPVKYASAKLGLARDELRLPLAPATESTKEKIDRLLSEYFPELGC